jgi:hypothetical protein
MKNWPSIRVRATVRHRENASLVVPQLRVKLVCEVIAGPADSLAERIAALNHEAVDDSDERWCRCSRASALSGSSADRSILGALRQPDKILDGSRRLLVEQAAR